MKTFIPLLLFALMIVSSNAQSLHSIGSNALMEMSCPESFRVVQETGVTAFVMPRKNDENGPISMRITCYRDAKKEGKDETFVKELLKELTGTNQTIKVGSNFYATSTEKRTDAKRMNWICKAFYISADGYVVFATVQIIESRKDEAQCRELLNSIPSIIQSIKRKKG